MLKKKQSIKTIVLLGFLGFFLISSGVYAQEEEGERAEPLPLQPDKLSFSQQISGKIDIGFHYSMWGINIVKGMFEEDLADALSKKIRGEIVDLIEGTNPFARETGYEQNITFDSWGHNYGLELRFYPQGREGAFSLGVSFEKTTLNLWVGGPISQDFEDGTYTEVDGEGYVRLNPFTTNLSFRWDWMPGWKVTPYFVLGLGVGANIGEVHYEYTGKYRYQTYAMDISDSGTFELIEAEEEIEFNIPNIMIIFQANFGLRAEIIPHFNLNAEAGIWNGFLLRFGASYRF